MFIYTQDDALVELSGSVRADSTPSYSGKYRVVMTRRGCTITLAEYDTAEEAKKAILFISVCLEGEKKVCVLDLPVMLDEYIESAYAQLNQQARREDIEFWK